MTKRDELIALGGIGVKVRELEWPPRCPRGQRVHNRPALVNYTVAHYGGDVGDAIYRWAEAHSPWSDPLPTYETAKAAAQADYETRILSALEAPAAGDGEPAFPTWDAEDEAYELGKLYGYESAIQDLDIATGGDGEFKGSTIPGCTVDAPGMKARIVGRANTAPPADAAMRGALDAIAPAVENLACHQEQCDLDGIMVKVSRQALDEVLNAINTLALTAPGATTKSDGASRP